MQVEFLRTMGATAMRRVKQFDYGSGKAQALRQRDGTPPWAVHVCELDSLPEPAGDDTSPFANAYREATALRAEIEGAT